MLPEQHPLRCGDNNSFLYPGANQEPSAPPLQIGRNSPDAIFFFLAILSESVSFFPVEQTRRKFQHHRLCLLDMSGTIGRLNDGTVRPLTTIGRTHVWHPTAATNYYQAMTSIENYETRLTSPVRKKEAITAIPICEFRPMDPSLYADSCYQLPSRSVFRCLWGPQRQECRRIHSGIVRMSAF